MRDPLVIGMDTKTRHFHWVASAPVQGREYGWVSHVAGRREDRSGDLARIELFRASRIFFTGLPPESRVYCEEPLALRMNPETTRLLCMVAGAIFAGFVQANPDAEWHWVNPATWKKQVLGRGIPPKGQKHKPWIEETLLADRRFVGWLHADPSRRGEFALEPDLYDAWCLMTYGMEVLDSSHGRTS